MIFGFGFSIENHLIFLWDWHISGVELLLNQVDIHERKYPIIKAASPW